jgi:hypothetical protein
MLLAFILSVITDVAIAFYIANYYPNVDEDSWKFILFGLALGAATLSFWRLVLGFIF